MSTLSLISRNRCFNGEQRYYSHHAVTTESQMTFSVYLPDEAIAGKMCPAIVYLSGLTCNADNVTHKGHFQELCSELGIIFIAPDTSPRGEDVPNDERYYVGQGASYYVDATKAPWSTHFNMQSYIIEELYDLIRSHFPISSVGITGHSMGGHGALLLGFKYPSKFVSVSAIAPVAEASSSEWGQVAFGAYFGNDDSNWSQHDATQAIRTAGKQYSSILVDQGEADEFYLDGKLQTEKLHQACLAVKQPLTLRYQAEHDHSYYFIQTVLADHIRHHYQAAMMHG